MPDTISDSIAIAAPAERVWSMISDVTRMPEWSPEQAATRWVGGATGPALGARFRGTNRNGWRRWSTSCKVTEFDPQRKFTFAVSSYGLPVSDWSYELTSTADGCTVTESTTDRRGVLIRVGGGVVTGVYDRATHNLAGIKTTLAALKSAAES
jgi:uncharacterized protein YndB with AHSA1/START domain